MRLYRSSATRSHLRRLTMAVLACGVAWAGPPASTASAQWTVINLHPVGATGSEAHGVRNGQQVGEVAVGGVAHASLWTGTAATWVDLHPAGAIDSDAWGVDAGHQVGWARVPSGFSIPPRASLWSGSAASWVDLTPDGAMNSIAYGMATGKQVGSADVDGFLQAIMWNGAASSWVNLHPAEASGGTVQRSELNGVGGRAQGDGLGRQVGWVQTTDFPPVPQSASLWAGSAASWVNLHPPGASSSRAWGVDIVDVSQVVGWATVGGVVRAALWGGPALSWVDLNPVASFASQAYGVDGGQQVGYFQPVGGNHASLWSGTAASLVDLHAFLPAGFTSSEARGIWHDETSTYVVGYGFNSNTGRREALMWMGPPDLIFRDGFDGGGGALTLGDRRPTRVRRRWASPPRIPSNDSA